MAAGSGNGKKGLRGIPKKDRVQDIIRELDEWTDEDGKRRRICRYRISHDLNNWLDEIALELGTSKSSLIREVLFTYVKYHKESKQLGKRKFLKIRETLDGWIKERLDIEVLNNTVKKNNQELQNRKVMDEVKMLSHQITVLAEMINLADKHKR